jgi:hypothetical protein
MSRNDLHRRLFGLRNQKIRLTTEVAVVDATGLPIDGHFDLLAGGEGGHRRDYGVHSPTTHQYLLNQNFHGPS